jgi:hypothetical protein
MCLELGDNSIRYPLGIAEDVPVKVGHHFIPVDFVVLEMGEREKPTLILGRPFLKTVGATIFLKATVGQSPPATKYIYNSYIGAPH